jgi:hypothetical protein
LDGFFIFILKSLICFNDFAVKRRRKDLSTMRMGAVAAIWWLTVVAAASRLSFLHASSPSSTTVPAFLWSPHHPRHQYASTVPYLCLLLFIFQFKPITCFS